MLSELIDILHAEECSLVMADSQGSIHRYYKKGVRDLEDLLNKEPELLRGATIADKVIGKAAAGMMAFGGVKEVYADVLSTKAVPLLKSNGLTYSYGKLVDHIIIPSGDNRCPLEKIVAPATNAVEVVTLLRRHFAEMQSCR